MLDTVTLIKLAIGLLNTFWFFVGLGVGAYITRRAR